MRLTVNPAVLPHRVSETLTVPGDKSISHRALLIGGIINGVSEFSNLLDSQDIAATCNFVKSIGVKIEKHSDRVLVMGRGLANFCEPSQVLEMGNSGTTTRLGLGLVGPSNIFAVFTGDSSLQQRPMDRVIKPLAALGLSYLARDNNTRPPVVCLPSVHTKPATVTGTVASAQVKSAFLLAAAQINGFSSYTEPTPTRDHTELMLSAAGAEINVTKTTIEITGGQALNPLRFQIPGDPSSAAFWTVAALIGSNTTLTIRNVGINPRRSGFISVLQRMGGKVSINNRRNWGGEEVADLEVYSSPLSGCEILPAEIPDLIDEIPILAVAASVATGLTRITGASELRVKESDRIQSIVTELTKVGVPVRELPDGLEISGTAKILGADVECHQDHRIAMAMLILGLVAESPVSVNGAEIIATSYPDFEAAFTTLYGPASLQKIIY